MMESAEKNGLVIREWKWCQSKEQRTCDEVCKNNLDKGKCIQGKEGCSVKPKEMSEDVKASLRAYDKPRESRVGVNENNKLLLNMKKLGAKKISIISFENGGFISEKLINQWIYREKIPFKRIPQIEVLINSVQG